MTAFGPDAARAIRDAVERAESHTSGEIVPVIVARTGPHEAVLWRGVAVGAALGTVLVLVARALATGWSDPVLHAPYTLHAAVLAAAALGGILTRFVPSVFRALAGPSYLDRVAHARAMQAFLDHEVFDTRERTGIVLLVALQERRIEVLGDSGINALVGQDEWAEIVSVVRDGLRTGRAVEALVEAIGMCGALLERKGVERRADDRNELPDAPRIDPEAGGGA